MARAWMRVLQVRLTSKSLKKVMTFGSNGDVDRPELNIEIVGNKYMSALKDACTIRISNLTYSEMISIISGQFYDVEILCGYMHGNIFSIFNGGVLYVSNSKNDTKSNTVIILCASQLVAKYGQSRLNLTLNSGINMYAALNYVFKQAGIPNTNISTQFKTKFLNEVSSCNNSVASWIDKLTTSNDTFITNSDETMGATISIFDAAKSNLRTITLDSQNIILAGGFPQLTSDGVSISMMPTFSFVCGDTIEIDNSLIQIPVSSQNEVSSNYAYFLDNSGSKEGFGKYMIYEIGFSLQNRGATFSMNMLCKTRSLISKYVGD